MHFITDREISFQKLSVEKGILLKKLPYIMQYSE